jgi:N-formylglutamate deformylase
MSHPFELVRRDGPILVSIPHLGRTIPEDLCGGYTEEASSLADTDWHLDKLYDFAADIGATVLQATVSRYVIDLNRPATGESLYPGLVTTTLCPTETFTGEPLYRPGSEPSDGEVGRRIEAYWRPYHRVLAEEIARLQHRHGHILLWEAHSIASELPRLFSGRLPDLNFGTADGESCEDSVLAGAVAAVRATDCSWVVNGRFKGGFITRRYGNPTVGVHAIQLEMCKSLYMDEAAPFEWQAERARKLRPVVQASLEGALRALEKLPGSAPKGRTTLAGSKVPSNESIR